MYNPIHAKLQQLCEEFHIDEVTLKLAICLFISFPFNALLKRLPDQRVRLKCVYIVCVSAFYLFGILNLYDGFKTLLISTLFTYGITRFYRSRFMPYVNFVFVMAHLAMNHIHMQMSTDYDSSKVDITGAQMVLVMKLTAFAWSYYDGTYAKKEDLSAYQLHRSVTQHPSLLEFMAYAFFYPSLLTGPSFDYADFASWLRCEIFRDLPETKKPKRRWSRDKNQRRQIPKCGSLALGRVLQGIMWIALSFVSPNYVNVRSVLSPEFKARSMLYKMHYLYLLGTTFRFKYYAAWIISEASCMVCGLGYNGYDPDTQQIKWDRVQNVDIKAFEFAQNTRECLEAWNMNTNKWLKYYVYLRVTRKGKKPGFRSTLFTFLTSAFWHGTRPGYYLSFATGALFQTVGKIYRKNFRPMFLAEDGKTPLKSKVIYDFICSWVTKLAFGYLVQPFVILDLRKSLSCWSSVNFYVHIAIALTFLVFKGPFAKQAQMFCRRYHPVEIAKKQQKKAEAVSAEAAPTLGDILKDKAQFETNEAENMAMMLGIPDPSEVELEEAKKDLEEFYKQYDAWKRKNGLEVEEENLRDAFQNFKKEFRKTTRRMSFSDYAASPSKSK
ncbi:AGR271Cp [Eremothecium gossypii ATCC 10895]|uniref:AGR271Cp n=1 Tax=Eremothecium gossypii (strain ATCC 10895 / CBS 109.51 / FGSC 9923 / NRRL Y-1056) TaxID=284811 RepID=Q74ZC8_EREGS|nr:AGR271Cp [Eremothecium gossypii ATCC 10895]AAS54761.2 AGR271Cp [Eremothecium gossypii ATCC 10895]AEY99092.1 FAGR271Cp [Eremothecium gossypii FDAG1]